ncbi:hypothetical protein QE406_003287 [Microbacterium testaceum]|nr:hypothetical protein [Microbacterium testaceum]
MPGVGVHVPVAPVRVEPIAAFPVMVGAGAVVNEAVVAALASLVTEVRGYPVLMPMAVTVIFVPASWAASLYVGAVAPAISVPLRRHWYANESGAGFHVPVTAVSFEPTVIDPVKVGFGVTVKAAAFVRTVDVGDGVGSAQAAGTLPMLSATAMSIAAAAR